MKLNLKRFDPRSFLLLASLGASGIFAQPVLPPVGEAGEPPPPSRSTTAPAVALRAPTQPRSPFTWGGISLLPHPLYRFLYSDGLLSQRGHKLNTYIQNIAPGFLLQAGNNWILDYTPTWTNYSNRLFRDTLDHSVQFRATVPVPNWAVGFYQGYTSSSDVLIETARQTKQEDVRTELAVSHPFTSKVAIDLTAAQQLRFIENTDDVFDWSGGGWVHYQTSPRLDFGIGGNGGYTQIYHSPNLINLSPGAQVMWQPTDVITARLQGGIQVTRFISGGRSPLTTGMFDASLTYRPWDATALVLSAQRTVTPSYFRDDVTDGRSWRIDLRQRLVTHIQLNLGYDERRSHYILTRNQLTFDSSVEEITDENGHVIGTVTKTTAIPTTIFLRRNDVIRTVNLRLSATWLKRGTLAAIYQQGRNHSDAPGYSFLSHQIGVEVSWKY